MHMKYIFKTVVFVISLKHCCKLWLYRTSIRPISADTCIGGIYIYRRLANMSDLSLELCNVTVNYASIILLVHIQGV